MKKILMGVALATLIAAPASAADLPRRVPVTKAPAAVVPVAYNWTGFYIGVHGGGVWGDKDWEVTAINGAGVGFAAVGDTGSHDLDGWLAGGQVGFNVQAGQWVFGVEAQWSWTDANGSFTCAAAITCKTELNWLGTVAGRIGVAWDRVLLYVKGGWAFVDEDYKVTVAQVSFSEGHTRSGWMVGGGLEFAFAGNWSGKIEYNYMDFGNKSVTFGTTPDTGTVDIDQVLHVVKAGINYRFGGPVVARY
jgi:outer membrane immunogenic protein